MPEQPLLFSAKLQPQRRGWLGVALPGDSVTALGSRGQVRVMATVCGVPFETIAFPRGDGSHFLLVNAALRRRLGLVEGDSIDVAVERAASRAPAPMPVELQVELARSKDARLAWEALTAAARQVASRWIESAKSQEVREFRACDVVRRALRYRSGEGPFYPTKADQKLLSRPKATRRGPQHSR